MLVDRVNKMNVTGIPCAGHSHVLKMGVVWASITLDTAMCLTGAHYSFVTVSSRN